MTVLFIYLFIGNKSIFINEELYYVDYKQRKKFTKISLQTSCCNIYSSLLLLIKFSSKLLGKLLVSILVCFHAGFFGILKFNVFVWIIFKHKILSAYVAIIKLILDISQMCDFPSGNSPKIRLSILMHRRLKWGTSTAARKG